MKKFKFFLIISLLLTFLINQAGAFEKKIYFFPVVSSISNIKFSSKYTDILMEKLVGTDVFEIVPVKDFNYQSNPSKFDSLRTSVDNYCYIKGIKTALFGFILKGDYGYVVKIVLYSAENDGIIFEYNDTFIIESEIEASARNCAIEILAKHYSDESVKFFFGSLLMPGLGQLMMKNKVKGALFLGGMGFLAYMYINSGGQKSIENDTEIRVSQTEDNNMFKYFYMGEEVSYSYLKSIRNEYYNYNKDLDKKKSVLQLAAVAVYLINVGDILLSIKKFNNKQILRNKFTVSSIPVGKNLQFAVTYHF